MAVAAGLAVAGFAGAGPALASGASSSPTPCPSQGVLGAVTGTLCKTVKSVSSPSPVLPSPVSSVVGSVGSAVGSTVGGVTGTLGGSTGGTTSSGGSGSTGGTGTTGGSGARSGSHAKGATSGHPATTASALGAAGAGSPNLGVLSSLGVPGWLVRGGLGPLPSSTVPLSFPVVHPAAKALTQAAVKPTPRAVSSLWLVFAIGVACLVGVAGGLGRFEGRRRGGRRIPG